MEGCENGVERRALFLGGWERDYVAFLGGWERDYVAALADFARVGGWISFLEGTTECGVSSEDLVNVRDFGIVPFQGWSRGSLMG